MERWNYPEFPYDDEDISDEDCQDSGEEESVDNMEDNSNHDSENYGGIYGDDLGQYSGEEYTEDDSMARDDARLSLANQDEEAEEDEEEHIMSPASREAEIERMIDSMKDCSEVLHLKQDKQPKARNFVTILEEGKKFDDKAFRAAAEKQFDLVSKAQSGPLVAKHHEHKYAGNITLRERLDISNEGLRIDKNVVKNLLDPSFAERYADNPQIEIKQKGSNHRNNNRRKQVRIAEKERKARLQEAQEAQEAIVEQHPADNDSADPHKKRNPATPQKPKYTKKQTPGSKRKMKSPKPSSSKRRKPAGRRRQNTGDETDEEEDVQQSPTKQRQQHHSVPRPPSHHNQSITQRGDAVFMVAPAAQMEPGSVEQSPQQSAHRSGPTGLPGAAQAAYNNNNNMPGFDFLLPNNVGSNIYDQIVRLETEHQNRSLDRNGLIALARGYRVVICDLLGVNRQHADKNSLLALRMYARAFYQPLENVNWYYPRMPAAYQAGLGQHVLLRSGAPNEVFPFAVLWRQDSPLTDLAIERGDAFVDGTVPYAGGPINWLRQPAEANGLEARALGFEVPGYLPEQYFSANAIDPR